MKLMACVAWSASLSLLAQPVHMKLAVGGCSVLSGQNWTEPWQPPAWFPSGSGGSGPSFDIPYIRHKALGVQVPWKKGLAWEVDLSSDNPGSVLRCDTAVFALRWVADPDDTGGAELFLGVGYSRLKGYEAAAAPRWRRVEATQSFILENPEDLRHLDRAAPALRLGGAVFFTRRFGLEALVQIHPIPKGNGPDESTGATLRTGILRAVYRFSFE